MPRVMRAMKEASLLGLFCLCSVWTANSFVGRLLPRILSRASPTFSGPEIQPSIHYMHASAAQTTLRASRLTPETMIYCNRELNLDTIAAVGFDMDYTLAQYKPEFDLLAYNEAKKKLVDWLGYPSVVNTLQYDGNIARRGCIIDCKRGNVLKLDQHRYVRAVEHGLTPLSREQRKTLYRASYQEAETFSGRDFSNIDTPFSLVDACLYAQLVDLKDRSAKQVLAEAAPRSDPTPGLDYESSQAAPRALKSAFFNGKSYADLWQDLRRSVERCHKDGSIKLKVAQDPAKYIIHDDKLFPTLENLRRGGRKLFLLTNSLFDYTQVVMNYIYDRSRVAAHQRGSDWMQHFDLIIVGGNKPAFIQDDANALALYQVDAQSGVLSNCAAPPKTPTQAVHFLQRHGKVYQGGNAQILHSLLGVPCGENLMYVGDHIFADMLRSKRTLGWRTCLVVPELVREAETYQRLGADRQELRRLRRQKEVFEAEFGALLEGEQQRPGEQPAEIADEEQTAAPESSTANDSRNAEGHMRLEEEITNLRASIRSKFAEYDSAFHSRWGQLFKAGFQESRFSKQLRDYACLYTSKVSNLASLSPCRPLRPRKDLMPHDRYHAREEV